MQIRQIAALKQAVQEPVHKSHSQMFQDIYIHIHEEKYPCLLLAAKRTQKHPPKQGYISSFSVALRPTNDSSHSCFLCRTTTGKPDIPPFKTCAYILTCIRLKSYTLNKSHYVHNFNELGNVST